MRLKLQLLLFVCFLSNPYISEARASGDTNSQVTSPSLGNDGAPDQPGSNIETTHLNIGDINQPHDEGSCLFNSSTSLNCRSNRPGQTFHYHMKSLPDLYRNLAQAAAGSDDEDSDDPGSSSSRFIININSIRDTFHDVYRYYLPIPPNLAVAALTRNQGGTFPAHPDTAPGLFSSKDGHEDPAVNPSHEDIPQWRDEEDLVLVEDELVTPRLSLECAMDVMAIYLVFNTNASTAEGGTAAELLENIWPLQMMDSWGKSEDGILSGNLHRLGFMKECLDTTAGQQLGFSGQYCLVQPLKNRNSSSAGLLPTLYGTCIPSTCTSLELQSSLNYQLAPLHYSASTVSCQQRDEPLHFGTWETTTCAIIGLMMLIVLGSTIIDLVLRDNCPFVCKAFSAAENMAKIWAVKIDAPGEISCIHGIRVLSISWIILGHHYAYILQYGDNKSELPQMTSGWPFQLVWSGYKAVDTFFTIGGLLLVKSLLKENFCIDTSFDVLPSSRDMESVAMASTLTLVRNSSKSSEKSLVQEQVDDPAKQESPSTVVRKDNSLVDVVLWNKLVRQGLWKTVTTFLYHYLWYIFNRIVRLWPTMFLIIMYCAGPSAFFISGPYKPRYEDEYLDSCRTNWWVDLTFFSNVIFVVTGLKAETDPEYTKPVDSCVSHSWYIAVDLQLQLVMPFLILPCKLLRHKGLYIMCLILLTSLIPGLLVILKDLMPAMMLTVNGQASLNYSRAIYMMPYARASPYLVGALCGLLLHQAWADQQGSDVRSCPRWLTILHTKPVLLVGWTVFIASGLAVIFGLTASNVIPTPGTEVHQLSAFEDFLYASLASTVWAICVGWMVVICALGLAGPINLFLSHPMWQPLSRVTYSVYLISLPIQKMVFYSFYRDLYLTHTIIILSCCGIVVVSFLAAFAISLVAESPFISLNKSKLKRRT